MGKQIAFRLIKSRRFPDREYLALAFSHFGGDEEFRFVAQYWDVDGDYLGSLPDGHIQYNGPRCYDDPEIWFADDPYWEVFAENTEIDQEEFLRAFEDYLDTTEAQ